MPYLAVNGNMFAFVDPEGALCLRFAEADRAALAEDFGAGPVMQYDAVMRGYVAIPAAVLGDADAARRSVRPMRRPCHGAQPKPTKR